MTDPLFRMLENLPPAEPDEVHAARVRARCHAVLERHRPRRSVRRRSGTRVWEAVVAGLGAIYLVETIRQAMHLYGLL